MHMSGPQDGQELRARYVGRIDELFTWNPCMAGARSSHNRHYLQRVGTFATQPLTAIARHYLAETPSYSIISCLTEHIVPSNS